MAQLRYTATRRALEHLLALGAAARSLKPVLKDNCPKLDNVQSGYTVGPEWRVRVAKNGLLRKEGVGVNKSWFSRVSLQGLAWAALLGNTVVILQGAFVRATGAGAGCGSHWPTCNGDIIPLGAGTQTLIEFSHRLLSAGVLVLGVWLVLKTYKVRKTQPGFFVFAAAAFGLLIIEALLGASTVLLELTGETVSTARGVMVATHLVNSLLLVGALTLTVVYAKARAPWPLRLAQQGGVATVLLVGLVGMLVVVFSGGIAALGNTMFPSESLRAGLAADFDPNSHILVRLRLLHPVIAVTVGLYLFLSLGLSRYLKPVPEAGRLTQILFSVYLAQLLIGTLNLAFLAPIALQLLHLATAVAAFALLTALSAYTLGFEAVPQVAPAAPLQRAKAE